ncbi:MAG: hypothetical protein RL660_767 [Bacteroidota bacterium]|jgi:hypothetical protein
MATSKVYVNLLPYWPSISWCAYAIQQHELPLANLPYQKQYKLNQFSIAAANGLLQLSAPLQGGREQHTLVSEILLSNTEQWQKQHAQSIKSAYGKAPFFDELWPRIASIYEQQFEQLNDLNTAILTFVMQCLKHDLQVAPTAAAPLCLAEPLTVQYQQLFRDRYGFLPNLSVLDLLMCEGAYAKQLLTNAVS